MIPASVAVAREEPAAPPEPVVPWDGGDVPEMAEDDLPPSDPLIFGAATAEATQATPVETAQPAEAAAASAAAVTEPVVPEAAVEAARPRSKSHRPRRPQRRGRGRTGRGRGRTRGGRGRSPRWSRPHPR